MALIRQHWDGGLQRYVEETEIDAWWEGDIDWASDRQAEEDSVGSTLSTPVANEEPDAGDVRDTLEGFTPVGWYWQGHIGHFR